MIAAETPILEAVFVALCDDATDISDLWRAWARIDDIFWDIVERGTK